MSQKGAFSRFYGLMAAVMKVMASHGSSLNTASPILLAKAIEECGGYRSRGHGQSKWSGRKPNTNKSTNWFKGHYEHDWRTGARLLVKSPAPHGGGAREVVRRQCQLAAGTLFTN